MCGEFQKQKAAESTKKRVAKPGQRIQPRRGRQKTLKQKKMEAAAASRAKAPVQGMSARMACKGLGMVGIEAKPLHVALGLEANVEETEEDENDEIPSLAMDSEEEDADWDKCSSTKDVSRIRDTYSLLT